MSELPAKSVGLPVKDVLIVDDDESIRRLVCIAMERSGLTCDTAEDGVAALECLERTRYHVVLSDLMMPRLDGGALVRQLAAIETASDGHPLVLIMTAFPQAEQLPLLSDLVQAVVRKPFNVLELTQLVQSCVTMHREEESSPPENRM